MQEILEMSFLLKVEDNFYSEKEVAARIDDFKKLVRSKIDLETTEGAWSIRYYGEELLGTVYWDEITLAIDCIAGSLLTTQNHTISEFLSLQSIWIRLTPLGSTLLYQLESANVSRTFSIKKGLPTKLFYQKFFAMYMRMVKIMANLGSSSYLITQEEWANAVPNGIKTLGIEPNKILQLARKSIIEMADELV